MLSAPVLLLTLAKLAIYQTRMEAMTIGNLEMVGLFSCHSFVHVSRQSFAGLHPQVPWICGHCPVFSAQCPHFKTLSIWPSAIFRFSLLLSQEFCYCTLNTSVTFFWFRETYIFLMGLRQPNLMLLTGLSLLWSLVLSIWLLSLPWFISNNLFLALAFCLGLLAIALWHLTLDILGLPSASSLWLDIQVVGFWQLTHNFFPWTYLLLMPLWHFDTLATDWWLLTSAWTFDQTPLPLVTSHYAEPSWLIMTGWTQVWVGWVGLAFRTRRFMDESLRLARQRDWNRDGDSDLVRGSSTGRHREDWDWMEGLGRGELRK